MKTKRPEWFKRDRLSRLSNVLWSNLADAETVAEMNSVLKGEGRKPLRPSNLLSNAKRGPVSPLGGLAVKGKR